MSSSRKNSPGMIRSLLTIARKKAPQVVDDLLTTFEEEFDLIKEETTDPNSWTRTAIREAGLVAAGAATAAVGPGLICLADTGMASRLPTKYAALASYESSMTCTDDLLSPKVMLPLAAAGAYLTHRYFKNNPGKLRVSTENTNNEAKRSAPRPGRKSE